MLLGWGFLVVLFLFGWFLFGGGLEVVVVWVGLVGGGGCFVTFWVAVSKAMFAT